MILSMRARPDVTIVDYGMGNLRSVSKAAEHLGFKALVTSRPADIRSAQRLIFPGVGAFPKAMEELRQRKLVEPLRDYLSSGRPFLGICLGLQLLFQQSEEGPAEGLGIFPGRVVRFRHALKIPHMGWNQVRRATKAANDCPLLRGVQDGTNFYFVHSYYPKPEDSSLACLKTHYGEDFASMIWRKNIFATQFHPEKSQTKGLAMLKAFLSLPFVRGG